eukprot:CAMPEP_0169469928 /NCGR_PEP_ID=MMETSP1042-20121227/23741_1 /TAXON_ID=464988 /ORGANISM="Hemiselmis andersenii, Strain CCMP1180" /LENGTH=82 /DNA_ID=CAMNT_0009583437 /DNA_START=270 /DNA_END=518 /DNA_ORIENTATION=-
MAPAQKTPAAPSYNLGRTDARESSPTPRGLPPPAQPFKSQPLPPTRFMGPAAAQTPGAGRAHHLDALHTRAGRPRQGSTRSP